MKIGVVHGRFQLFHNGHLNGLILPALGKVDHLIIGICNPEDSLTAFDATNPHRSEKQNNPFSYWERNKMITDTMHSVGVMSEQFTIVPFPINFPEKILNYVPMDAIYFLTIYDEWGRKKKAVLENLGVHVEVLKELSLEERGVTGSQIRRMILDKDMHWKHFVPKSIVYALETDRLIEKIV